MLAKKEEGGFWEDKVFKVVRVIKDFNDPNDSNDFNDLNDLNDPKDSTAFNNLPAPIVLLIVLPHISADVH